MKVLPRKKLYLLIRRRSPSTTRKLHQLFIIFLYLYFIFHFLNLSVINFLNLSVIHFLNLSVIKYPKSVSSKTGAL
jgi:hypothetical protein